MASARDVFLLDAALGHFFAQQVESYVQQEGRGNLDLIASHGHTIFHDPVMGSSLKLVGLMPWHLLLNVLSSMIFVLLI